MDRRAAEAQCRMLVRRVAPNARIYFPRRPLGRAIARGTSWNGRHLRPTGATLESQLHEVAHLLLAAPHRLHEVEFGLGPDPYRRYDVPRTIPEAEADLEELHTCWLQLLLTHLLELDVEAVRYEYELSPLTLEMIATLEQTYPGALPEPWWERGRRLLEDEPAQSSER